MASVLLLAALAAAAGAAGGARPPATIVFASDRADSSAVYAVDAAGGALREVVPNAEAPQWSPDGSRLAFVRAPAADPFRAELWVDDLRTGRQRPVAALLRAYAWAPDGGTIAFRERVAARISVVRTTGGAATPLTAPPQDFEDDEPVWSPTGGQIAFLRSTRRAVDSRLMVVGASGRGLRELARRVFYAPSWSPDGSRLLFESSGLHGTGPFVPTLYVGDADGRRVRVLSRASPAGAAWSPDGAWIAFVATARGGRQALDVVHPDGSGLRPLFTARFASTPVWSPDSLRIAITGGDRRSDVWVTGLTGRARRLTEGWRYGYSTASPVWRPGGPQAPPLRAHVVPAALASDSVAAGNVLRTTRPVASLAADGSRVALWYATALSTPARRCIEVWDVPRGAVTRFDYCRPAEGDRLVLAGDRVLWTTFAHGLGTNVYGVAGGTTDAPAPTYLSGLCPPPLFAGPCIRDPLGDLATDGALVVFDSWQGPAPICNEPCPPPKHDARLYRVNGAAAVPIASSAGELTPMAVDGGRILVGTGGGRLELLDGAGSLLLTLDGAGYEDAAMGGGIVVARHGDSLVSFDVATGAAGRPWPLPAGARLEDVDSGVVAYTSGAAVHLLRLADGRDAAIDVPGGGPVHAQLDASGLFYSYSVADPRRRGRVQFVPAGELPG